MYEVKHTAAWKFGVARIVLGLLVACVAGSAQTTLQIAPSTNNVVYLGNTIGTPITGVPLTQTNSNIGTLVAETAPPYNWTFVSGDLDGLTLLPQTTAYASAAISGIPAKLGTFTFTLQVSDSGTPAQTASQTYAINVILPPPLTSAGPFPGGEVGQPYPTDITIIGGVPPYTWSYAPGSAPLPNGLQLVANPGQSIQPITGTPTQAGTTTVGLQVTDSNPNGPQSLTLIVPLSVAYASVQTPPAEGPSSLANTPQAIASGPDGALWFTSGAATGPLDNSGAELYTIGRVTTNFAFTTPSYALPDVVSFGNLAPQQAFYMVTGKDGNLWYTSSDSLGAISRTGSVVTSVTLPNPTANGETIVVTPHQIAAGSDNSIWFTGQGFGQTTFATYGFIGRIDLSDPNHAVQQFLIQQNPGTAPEGIVQGDDGAIWFTDVGVDANGLQMALIGRMVWDPVHKTAKLSPPPACNANTPANLTLECPVPGTTGYSNSSVSIASAPTIALGPNHTLWFTDNNSNQIASITEDAQTVHLYSVPTPGQGINPGLSAITLGPDGAMWFTENSSVPGVGRITTNGLITEFPNPNSSNTSQSITAGADGALWFLDGFDVGRIVPPLAFACFYATSAETGLQYSSSCPVIAGTGPYTYSVTGALPPGVTLSAATGALVGNAQATGQYQFTITAKDSGSPQETASQLVTITVAPRPPLVLTCNAPATGQVGVAYSATCAASGGIAPYTFVLSAGALPPGVSFNTATGALSGTPAPNTYGTYSVTVQATDAGVPAFVSQQVITIAVSPAPLTLSCNLAGQAEVNVPYSRHCVANGGVIPYNFSIAGTGTLPDGLSIDSVAGTVSGTPFTAATFAFSVQVSDSGTSAQNALKQIVTNPYSITVLPAQLGLTCDFSRPGVVGSPYSTTCVAANGTQPYTFSLAAGSTLPAGLSVNPTTGVISGRPTTAGSANFTLQVQDTSTPTLTAKQIVRFRVASAVLVITTTTLPNGNVALPYSGNPLAEGGTGPYHWTLSSGSLPAGLGLNAGTGAVTGKPTLAGAYSFTLQVSDSSGTPATAVQAFSGTIGGPVAPDFAEFALPTASGVNGIVTGPDGALWFTTADQAAGNLIGRITSAGAITTLASPNALSNNPKANGIAVGPDGNLWFSETDANSVGTVSPDGSTLVDFPLTESSPQQIAAGADGNLWATAFGSSAVIQVNPDGTAASPLSTPTAGSGPTGMVLGPDGALWFTEQTAGAIGRVLPGGQPTEYSLGQGTHQPTSIAVGPDGALWFTDTGANSIGRIAVDGTITETVITTPGSGPQGIIAGADGALYFTELTANQIGRITTDGQITEFAAPTAASGLQGIALGPDGNLWFGENSANKIGRFMFVSQEQITCTFPSSGIPVNSSYSASCAAALGTGPYTYSIVQGALPPGVTLSSSTGAITGTVTLAGTYSYTVQALDSSAPAQVVIQQAPSFTVLPAPEALTCTIPSTGVVATAYAGSTCAPTGGTPPYAFAISTGTLPPGLALDPALGAITGTPTAPGTYGFTIQITDAGSPAQVVTQSASISVQFGIVTGTGSPLFTVLGLPASQLDFSNITNLNLQLNQVSPTDLSGSVTLSFQAYANDAPSIITTNGYIDPALQFVDSSAKPLGLIYKFTIPAGSKTVGLPNIDPGSVAGTITASITFTGTTQPLGSIVIPQLAPVIEPGSVQITNVTSSGFDVELIATSDIRTLTFANFTFTPSQGSTIQGFTAFQFDISQATADWFASPAGLSFGGNLSLTFPFTLTGPVTGIQSVTVVLDDGFGKSVPVTGNR